MATLVRLLNNYNLAEEAMQEAFSIAVEKWSIEGVPGNPYSWLVSTGKFKAIDQMRRSERRQNVVNDDLITPNSYQNQPEIHTTFIEDDQLRLIYYCCHPLLSH